jgi:hypothetical protein
VVLETEPEYRTYERTWLVTPERQLCFLCREKAQIAEDRSTLDIDAMDRAIAKAVRKYGAREVLVNG